MPTLPHRHGRACDDEILAMWDRFFLPLISLDFLDSGSPLLNWTVYGYFSALVVPQIVCERLRNWLVVYLAAPGFNRQTTMRFGATLLAEMANDLQTWYNAGLLTRLWFGEGANELIAHAQERGVWLGRMN